MSFIDMNNVDKKAEKPLKHVFKFITSEKNTKAEKHDYLKQIIYACQLQLINFKKLDSRKIEYIASLNDSKAFEAINLGILKRERETDSKPDKQIWECKACGYSGNVRDIVCPECHNSYFTLKEKPDTVVTSREDFDWMHEMLFYYLSEYSDIASQNNLKRIKKEVEKLNHVLGVLLEAKKEERDRETDTITISRKLFDRIKNFFNEHDSQTEEWVNKELDGLYEDFKDVRITDISRINYEQKYNDLKKHTFEAFMKEKALGEKDVSKNEENEVKSEK